MSLVYSTRYTQQKLWWHCSLKKVPSVSNSKAYIWDLLRLTRHMIASTMLLDVHTAARTRLGSHVLNSLLTQLVLCLLRLVTAAFPVRLPRPVTLQADFVVTIGACDQLFATLGVFAVFGREVQPALGGKACDVRFSPRESVLCDGFVVAVVG